MEETKLSVITLGGIGGKASIDKEQAQEKTYISLINYENHHETEQQGHMSLR